MFTYVHNFLKWYLIIHLVPKPRMLLVGRDLCRLLGSAAPLQVTAVHFQTSRRAVHVLKCLVQLTCLCFLIGLSHVCKRAELYRLELLLAAAFVTLLVHNIFKKLEGWALLTDVSIVTAISDGTGAKHRATEIQPKCLE